MRILTYTSLFPNAAQGELGIFVENRLRHLVAGGEVQARVIAPVPWFPSSGSWFGRYAAFARAPSRERRGDIDVLHPRFPVLPKAGSAVTPLAMAAFSRRALERVEAEGFAIDLIDAHYFYPDGVAAAMLARWYDKPLVITARGTDVNSIPASPLARRMILRAAARADHVVTVCQALKDRLIELSVPERKITVLRNGVDLELFRPMDRARVRVELGVAGPTLLSVGHLIERKGHDLCLRALAGLPGLQLVIAGSGVERSRLERLADSLGVAPRVRFLGQVPHSELPRWYAAADALLLASSREGWANVLLESMACGTPVVATDIWGTPEVVASRDAGVLMRERTPGAMIDAIRELLADYPDRAATRRYAEQFDWGATSRGQEALFAGILARRGSSDAARTPGVDDFRQQGT